MYNHKMCEVDIFISELDPINVFKLADTLYLCPLLLREVVIEHKRKIYKDVHSKCYELYEENGKYRRDPILISRHLIDKFNFSLRKYINDRITSHFETIKEEAINRTMRSTIIGMEDKLFLEVIELVNYEYITC